MLGQIARGHLSVPPVVNFHAGYSERNSGLHKRIAHLLLKDRPWGRYSAAAPPRRLAQVGLRHNLRQPALHLRPRDIVPATDLVARPWATPQPLAAAPTRRSRRQHSWFREALIEPSRNQRASPQLCFSARSDDNHSICFDAVRINGHVPLPALNSRADGVAYAFVFHRLRLNQNQKPGNDQY